MSIWILKMTALFPVRGEKDRTNLNGREGRPSRDNSHILMQFEYDVQRNNLTLSRNLTKGALVGDSSGNET